jgi:hypothetical protein
MLLEAWSGARHTAHPHHGQGRGDGLPWINGVTDKGVLGSFGLMQQQRPPTPDWLGEPVSAPQTDPLGCVTNLRSTQAR